MTTISGEVAAHLLGLPSGFDTSETVTATPLDRLCHDVFVTALEGGINYWAGVYAYRYLTDDDSSDDLIGFYAVICDYEDSEQKHRIDRAVIARGMRLIMAGQVRVSDSLQAEVWKVYHDPAEYDYDLDSWDADCIVQAGLFGEVIYG